MAFFFGMPAAIIRQLVRSEVPDGLEKIVRWIAVDNKLQAVVELEVVKAANNILAFVNASLNCSVN